MREFIRRALQKSSRMNTEQIQSLLAMVVEEYERLDAVLESLSIGVIVCDSYHIVMHNNKIAARILPLDLADAQDIPVWDCILVQEIADYIKAKIISEETIIAREFRLEDSTGIRYLSLNITPYVQSKTVCGTVITIRDITDKKNEEIRNRRLESLASLTNLAATVAHEIKNPLGSMSIYIQLIQKKLSSVDMDESGQIKKYLAIVEEEIERLNKIVVDFLTAVRPIPLTLAPLDVKTLVESVADFFSAEMSELKIELSLKLAKNILPVNGDERLLRQVLINLIKNAMGAIEGEGKITIKTWEENDMIHLSIIDNGKGIPSEILQKIFEPYFSTKVDGTGLGLAMAYKVVKEHGEIFPFSHQ
ncbi:PAS domain S-box protein [Brucepastera parasyntrophica]|uniref:sensor histidine kinase n=1 Tax=Brucepastera parasyntrophica TaxID=2880008 RepID=UPI00210D7E0B|nr:ATP-binding protein [Brucepastera parasyntrophica]ULQ59819.1 PAS domain S-box protein [Brucepastera parasyntrophica]